MKENIPSFFYLKIFILIIVLLVIGSVVFKLISEVVGSSFVNNSFSVLVVNKDSKLIYVDKKAKNAYLLSLGDIRQYVKGKNPLGASISLGLPINAMIFTEKSASNFTEFVNSDNELQLIFGGSVVRKNINGYDLFKLMNEIRSIPKDNKKEIKVNIFNESEVKDKLEDIFFDSVIKNSTLTIEIENATSINGLGSIIALILSREGYNVVAIKTSEEDGNSFIASDNENSSYINSLFGLTRFDLVKSTKSKTADVTIFLGEDLDAMLSP